MFGCCDEGGHTGFGATNALTNATGAPGNKSGLPTGNVQMWAGTPVPTRTGQDLAGCLAYVKKYRGIYGHDPAGVWCVGQQPPITAPPLILPPPVIQPAPPVMQPPSDLPTGGPRCSTGFIPQNGNCVPVMPVTNLPPPVRTPPIGPIWGRWAWKRRKPPVRRPYVPKPKPTPVIAVAPVEICPVRGYTSREIPGANEYQNFRCTPGQPVTIDAGLQAAGRQDAMARHGLSGLDGFSIGSVELPDWALYAGLGLVAYLLLKKGRR